MIFKLKRIHLIYLCFGCICTPLSLAQNVDPSIEVAEIERVQSERDRIFSALIDDPTNMDNLFQYANLSILIGDLEAAVGVFEQMLIYDNELPRIRLELGVLYYRLGTYTTAKVYLDSVKRYNPPSEVLENLDKDRDFLKQGNVFTDDQIDAYIALKFEEIYNLEHTPHPMEFEMYYSC